MNTYKSLYSLSDIIKYYARYFVISVTAVNIYNL